jgi:uncharacterized LabA/DUF88 family protein
MGRLDARESRLARVIVYVDGFNLYYGIRAKCGRKHLWLDIEALAQRLMRPGQRLLEVKYFTARFRDDSVAVRAQTMYLDAIEACCSRVRLIEGRFQEKQCVCRDCGSKWLEYEEKETDVSIATALIEDAILDRYDTALLISADSDLCPAVAAARRLRSEKRIIGVFPPGRHSTVLQRAVDGCSYVAVNKIRQSQLPEVIPAGDGVVLRRPPG